MTAPANTPCPVAELLEAPPAHDLFSTVERDDSTLRILVEGEPKPQLPAVLISSGLVFIAAAFICPPLILVAIGVLIVGMVVLGKIVVFAPDLLDAPVDTQKLIIGEHDIQFIESCPRRFEELRASGDYDAITERTLARDEVESAQLLLDSHDDSAGGIHLMVHDGDALVFGGPLLQRADDDKEEIVHRELEWLFEIVDTELTDR